MEQASYPVSWEHGKLCLTTGALYGVFLTSLAALGVVAWFGGSAVREVKDTRAYAFEMMRAAQAAEETLHQELKGLHTQLEAEFKAVNDDLAQQRIYVQATSDTLWATLTPEKQIHADFFRRIRTLEFQQDLARKTHQ